MHALKLARPVGPSYIIVVLRLPPTIAKPFHEIFSTPFTPWNFSLCDCCNNHPIMDSELIYSISGLAGKTQGAPSSVRSGRGFSALQV